MMRKLCGNVIFLVLVFILNSLCDAKISNLRLCADPKCSEPISLGITQVNYNSVDKYVLGFRANVHVKIFSKSAGSEQNYWGAEIQGRRGYVPKNLIREMRVLTNKLDHEVPTELAQEEAGIDLNAEGEVSEENNETLPDAPSATEVPEEEIAPEEKEEEGFFSQIFGGSSEKAEDAKVVQDVDNALDAEKDSSPDTEGDSEEEYDEEEEEEYDEEEEEEDESTEETQDVTSENPINIDEMPVVPEEGEIFQERKILSTVEELPEEPSEAQSAEQIAQENPQETISGENKQTVDETTVNSEEPTTPQTQDTHYYPDDFVTEPTVFETTSGEEIFSAEVPEFKPIPPEIQQDVQVPETLPNSPEISQNINENELSQESLGGSKEIPVVTEIPQETDAPQEVPEVTEAPKEVPEVTEAPEEVPNVPEVREEIPVVETVDEHPAPQEIIPPHLPNVPEFQTDSPEATTFPPIHQHLPPLVQIPPIYQTPEEKYPEVPPLPTIPEIPPEIVEKVEEVPELPPKIEVPVVPDVNESMGVGSFEEIKPDDKVEHEDVKEVHSGFFSGLFGSIKETLNMKMGKDVEKLADEVCIEDYCFRPQSQELRHPMVSNQPARPQNEAVRSTSLTFDEFLHLLMDQLLEMSSLIFYLSITAGAILLFTFGHYLVVQCSRERQLVFRLNAVERKLMVSVKECGSVKGELLETREKLMSIQDNSFGSNDMVIALRAELDSSEIQRENLLEQVASLEKELENAAEAGLELNRMVSELLSNQSGSDSIISSVEELQKQLNEQQNTILTINASLAEKSRENSELQVSLASQSEQFAEETEHLREECARSAEEKVQMTESLAKLQETLDALKKEHGTESRELKQQIQMHQGRYEDISKALTQQQSRVQVLEDCIKTLKQDGGNKGNFEEIMNVANLKTQLVAATKEKQVMKEKLEEENEARKLLEDHVKIVGEEVEKLRREYNDAEKERLEAQTRLEVLTSYFKDKETQLQKELSVKEAMWMKSQGETTSTVEKIRTMQDEIQTLKSQNDALRAEIEAQRAAHKAQIGALETRAQESWLATRQAERRLEESRIESSTLRRKLTSFAENGVNSNATNNIDGMTDVSSPLHDNPGSPLMGVLPPPPFMPPFMPPPPPFMPPGPFIPAEMRLPPLGRLMSPPPANNRYSPNPVDVRDGRFSPPDRGRYSPDRYRYPMSPYETETDVSPPPTPPPPRGGYRGYSAYSPQPHRQQSPHSHEERVKQFKGGLSSGSADSLGPRKSGGNTKV
uniref:Putative transport and golgi organization protein 1 n=2 Tax=Nyssomyia neivai TaxID=330878 RepID=A0A1L8DUW7_9DIPT